MTALRAEAPARGLSGVMVLALALFLPAGAPSWAQPIGPPQPIYVPNPGGGQNPGQPSDPPRGQRTGSSDFYGGPVQSKPLGQIDRSGSGLLTAGSGGLPPEMWQGTDPALAIQLVGQLPAAPPARPLRDLMFRLLATAATPPAGISGSDLFIARLRKLAAIGEAEAVNNLLQQSGAAGDEIGLRIVADALLLAGDTEKPCRDIAPLARQFPDIYWLKLNILCQIVAGDQREAMLSIDLLRERNPREQNFLILADMAAQQQPGKPATAPDTDALSLTLLRLARQPMPAALLRNPPPPLLRYIVANEGLGLAQRLEAAERGEALAVIDPEVLAKLYGQAAQLPKPPPGFPADLLQRAQAASAADKAPDLLQRAQALTLAFRLAQTRGLFGQMVRANGFKMGEIPVDQAYAAFAADATRAYLILGNVTLARRWYALLASNAYDPGYAKLHDWLYPLVQLGIHGPERTSWDNALLRRWYAVELERDKAGAPARAAMMISLLRAVGEPVEPDELNIALTLSARPGAYLLPPGVIAAMTRAANGHRIAETICYVLIAMGEQPLARIHPSVINAVTAALALIGYENVARATAVEAALAAGL